jgi:hypothetical protein
MELAPLSAVEFRPWLSGAPCRPGRVVRAMSAIARPRCGGSQLLNATPALFGYGL